MNYNDCGNYQGAVTLGNGMQSQAILWLFSQTYIPDHASRAMMYNFNGTFRGILNDRLSTVNTLGSWREDRAYFTNEPSASDVIMPSTHARVTRTSQLSENWTFVLQIRTLRNSPVYTGIPSSCNVDIYSGYVVDDPVSMVLFNGNNSDAINRNAILVTTHHTRYLEDDNDTCPIMVRRDIDIIPQQVIAGLQTNGETLGELRPDKIAQCIGVNDPYDTDSTSPMHIPLDQNADRNAIVGTEYSNPITHLMKLASGMASTIGQNSKNINIMGDGDMMNQLAADLTVELSPGNVSSYGPQMGSNLAPDQSFSIGQVEIEYPDITVNVIRQPSEQQVDLVNPFSPTRTNVLSSLISSCIPPLLAEHGFADISFSYRSFDMNDCDPQIPGGWYITSANPLCPMSPDAFRVRTNCLIIAIIKNVFGIVRTAIENTDFMVDISSSISGSTLVDLRIMDLANEYESGYYTTNNRLGGLNTSMLGTLDQQAANVQQYSNILRDANNTVQQHILQNQNRYI